MLDKKQRTNFVRQFNNSLKLTGVAISRKEINKDALRAYKENESLIIEAQREQTVIRIKRYYEKKGWIFPPKTHRYSTVVHLINDFYGKEVCKHTPKDNLEEKLKV